MRTRRTRDTLLSRLERLEVRTVGLQRVKVRFGKLRRSPEDYKGERHVIMTKELPNRNGQEWVEFEEVPGPDPNPRQQPAVWAPCPPTWTSCSYPPTHGRSRRHE